MLNSFLTHLTSGVLLAHVLLGCCAHHSHCCGEGHTPAISDTDTAESHDGEHHGCDPHRNHCQGTICYYLLPGSPQWRGVHSSLAQDLLLVAQGSGLAGLLTPVGHAVGPSDTAPPSLRRHLLCQVLLI